jgi:aspartate aminotransferase
LTPIGAFYLFPDFEPLRAKFAARGITTSDQLVRRLLDDTGVACLPGRAFGRDEAELTMRLAYVDFDGSAALGAAAGIPLDQPLPSGFCETHCATVLQAVDRIAEWADR